MLALIGPSHTRWVAPGSPSSMAGDDGQAFPDIEHALRYESLLPIARALREKVDWTDVRARTSESPFARAFFVMLEGLGILPEAEPTTGGRQARVRVLTPHGSGAATGG